MLIPSPQQRLSVRHRPQHRVPIMFQRWENLLFLHWEVDPETVRQSLPAGLSVDCHEGKAYVGIVPFFMRRVRFRGLPALPYISNFLECNVRRYVHDESGIPGVCFIPLMPTGARTGDPKGSRGVTLPVVGARRIGWLARSRARRGCYSKMARIL